MSTSKPLSEAKKQQFNVYAGGGVYLSAMSSVSERAGGRLRCESYASFQAIKPLALPRAEAIRACHMARAQGVQSWLVAAV